MNVFILTDTNHLVFLPIVKKYSISIYFHICECYSSTKFLQNFICILLLISLSLSILASSNHRLHETLKAQLYVLHSNLLHEIFVISNYQSSNLPHHHFTKLQIKYLSNICSKGRSWGTLIYFASLTLWTILKFNSLVVVNIHWGQFSMYVFQWITPVSFPWSFMVDKMNWEPFNDQFRWGNWFLTCIYIVCVGVNYDMKM